MKRKGKLNKNIVYLFVLCFLVVLIFKIPTSEQMRNQRAKEVTKQQEGQIDEIEKEKEKENETGKKEIGNVANHLSSESSGDKDTDIKTITSKETLVDVSLDTQSNSTNFIDEMTRDYEMDHYNTEVVTDNYFDGYGEYKSPDGWSYKGEWNKDVIEGKGTMQYPSGDSYVGEFDKGEKSGTGIYYFADGSVYSGEWSHDMWNGTGTFTSSQGFSYEGTFKNGIKSGQGTYQFVNGDQYSGEFDNDRENGHGVLISSQGYRYEGDFVNGQKHGNGKLIYENGASYEGDFVKNIKEGKGIETYLDENKTKIGTYEGAFQNNKRNGKGTFFYTNGVVMKGEWLDDEFVGEE